MKFRITVYYDRYRAEVLSEKDGEYHVIGNPPGYTTTHEAKEACKAYHERITSMIVEEFEL